MRALILCNGEPPGETLLREHVARADLIVCTDGAAHWAHAAGVTPHVVIGDMDSTTEPLAAEVVDCGPHGVQENTDAEKALLLALRRGARHIAILGATGRRLDHTLANVWLVARYHERAEIVLADEYGTLQVISGPTRLAAPPGGLISLVSLTADVTLDTMGLRWPLHGPLEIGSRGLSNEPTADEVFVDLHTGLIALIIPAAR